MATRRSQTLPFKSVVDKQKYFFKHQIFSSPGGERSLNFNKLGKLVVLVMEEVRRPNISAPFTHPTYNLCARGAENLWEMHPAMLNRNPLSESSQI